MSRIPQHRLSKPRQTKKALEKSHGGGTELNYEDSEEVAVVPDADETADHTADDDIVEIGDCPSAIQTSSPIGIDDDEITNTQ